LEQLFTLHALTSLLALTFMEILLGIDNVIFVSIILGRLKSDEDKKRASFIWMVVGVSMRILLLFTLAQLIAKTGELFSIMGHAVSFKDLITLGGGLFLLTSTTLEIHKKLEGEDPNAQANSKGNTFKAVIGQIILIDLVFSFDGIITAIGMVENDLFVVRIIAVLVAMVFMFTFAARISDFIHKHPTFKVLALSFLILISVILIVEGIHIEEVHFPHGYIYFAMAFSFSVEWLNMNINKASKKNKPVELREPHL
jgi:predicted tellurium resistance membrane protein TerC